MMQQAVLAAEPPRNDAAEPPRNDAAEPPREDAAEPPREDAAEPPRNDAAEPPREDAAGRTMTVNPDRIDGMECEQEDLLAFRDRVFCLCLGFAGNAADARDLAQDTFAKALANYAQAQPENPQAWIMRIARNTCLDLARRRKSRGPLHPVNEFAAVDWHTPEINAGQLEEILIVRKAIAGLPRRQRDVLVMREYGELSYEEIALALHINKGTVMSRLNRARQAVLRFYQEEHHGKRS